MARRFSLEALERAAKQAVEGIEFHTFWLGASMSGEREKVEPVKSKIKRELGLRLEKRWKKLARHDNPDVIVELDLDSGKAVAHITPLYLWGRYLKLVRGIPQTEWHCRRCRGRGCQRCNYTGKMYESSVQGLIQPAVIAAAKGRRANFHGAGREDIDVRMLGTGRPFVIEVIGPKKRSVDADKLQAAINGYAVGRVAVLGLKLAGVADIDAVKSQRHRKLYRAIVQIDKPVTKAILKKIESLAGRTIAQKTPTRVAHRRALLIRMRKIHLVKARKLSANKAELLIETDAGTYVKELVTGDSERTKPSISELVGGAKVVQLDVLAVG